MERKQGSQQRKREDHLVGDLRMDDHAWLAERGRVHVLDAPRRSRRRAVVLAVDDVADPADGKADHRGGATGVDELPVGELRAARPHVRSNHRAEQPAPLADAAFCEGKHAQELAAGEEPEVLPHVKQASADKSDDDHPRHPVGAA